MPNRQSLRGLSRAPRRKTAWTVGPGGTTEQVFNASQSLFLGTGTQILADELTLVRLRGRFAFNMESAAAIGERMTGAFGIGITTTPAFATGGITAVPTPITEIEWDGWLYWQAVMVQSVVSPLIEGGGGNRVEFEVDSKAMRKLKLDDVIFAVLEVVENGNVTANAFFNSRILVKLP